MEKQLIEKTDIIKSNKFGGEVFSSLLMNILQLDKINANYKKASKASNVEFLSEILSNLKISFTYNKEALENLPKGPFVVVSNHPYGGLDGIILLKIFLEKRPDFKVMANYMLQSIVPIKDNIIAVNPFKEKSTENLSGIRLFMQNLNEEHPVAIFPAGEVSSFQKGLNISDKKWTNSIVKLIKNSQVPIVPVYFSGTNSALFHILGKINPTLRTIKLPSELLNKKKKKIEVIIGSPISLKEQEKFESVEQFGLYIRARLYALKTKINPEPFFKYLQKPKIEEIAKQTQDSLIISEIEEIREKRKLFRVRNISAFCAPSEEIPYILKEIGRLRELTFRKVGEGTNLSRDLDQFDIYYDHLFLWDEENLKIIGAYRMGKGDKIYGKYGKNGFYVNSLFRFKKGFEPYLEKTIELGRSFVIDEYQKHPLPLYLLWKGILSTLLKNPQYKYLMGTVSISKDYSETSKNLISYYIYKNFFNKELASLIKPKKKFKIKFNESTSILKNEIDVPIQFFDKYIGKININGTRLPVLLKKYINLNGEIVGFNIDPKFNNCLDGLTILNIENIPKDIINSLMDDEMKNVQNAI